MDVAGIVKVFNRRRKALEEEYDKWKDHHKELSEYLLPRKARFLDTDTRANDGKRRNQKIINNAAGRALNTLASGMYSGLTSPSVNWFKLTIQDKDLAEFEEVKEWLEEVRKIMNWMLQKSNFYTSAHSTYKELGCFGTGFMLAEEDFQSFIRFYPFTIGQYYLATDQTLRVDSVYRTFNMSADQMVNMFGIDNVSESVANQYDNDNSESSYKVIHLIEPNDQRIKEVITQKKFRSVYYEDEKSAEKFLRVSGYDSFPGMGPRWDVTADEVYGRSPGMDVLGDVMMLQKMEDKKLRAVDKAVDPPLNAPSSMSKKAITSIPGSVNFVGKNDNTDSIRPTQMVQLDIGALQSSIASVVQDIREGLYYDLFRMVSALNDSPERTAYEIAKKNEEKLQLLGPVIERVQPEMLDKVIDRTFEIGLSRGIFPEAPEEMQGMELKVEYISILHQAQKMVGVTSIEQTVGFIGNLAGLRPDALDKLDVDEAVDQYGDMVGINPKIIHSKDEVEEKRQAQQQAAAEAQKNQMMQEGVDGAKTMSETDMGGNNALTQLMSGGQQ